MSNQVIGHYIEHKDPLLREFDHIISLMEDSLINRYGTELAGKLKTEARQEYEKLIPEIPYISGVRGRPLNFFLLCTAQGLAVYKAMKERGKPVGEVWEVCHEALRLRTAAIPKWKRWLLKYFMFSPMVMAIVKRRARKQEKAQLGDFEIEYLIGEGSDFDYGVNYLQCGNLKFVKNHGGEEFAPYICMADIALSDALGWGLVRTQTLADGCNHCDFRFKKGAATQISSRTPEIQETIERIRKKEG
ncbi:MAG: hypothetical protein HOJ79_13055 [Nitrospina sp.]|jgi:hypothetical protein|nr:hypothetical protein [Nitrospina sp.]